MEESDFNSEEWKKKLKGKSPEEIAEIVGKHYEKKYGSDRVFSPAKIIGLFLFALILILVFMVLLRLFSSLSP